MHLWQCFFFLLCVIKTMSSALTPEQIRRIEENKAKAQEILKRKAEAKDSDEQPKPLPKRARWTKYYEYDLSTMVDSKGGFITEETKEDKLVRERKEQATKLSPYIRKSSWSLRWINSKLIMHSCSNVGWSVWKSKMSRLPVNGRRSYLLPGVQNIGMSWMQGKVPRALQLNHKDRSKRG